MPTLWVAHPSFVPYWVRGELGAALGVLSGSHHLDQFVAEFAATIGRRGIPTASGRLAIELALRSFGVGSGDEVVIPTFTCAAVASAVRETGAAVRLADIDETYNINAGSIERVLSLRTRAVIVVHNGGLRADIEPIRALASSRGFALIEDCAQATGGRTGGSFWGGSGDASIFSFGLGKIMQATAGGMVCGIGEEPPVCLGTERRRTSFARLATVFWKYSLARFTRPFAIVLDRAVARRPEDRTEPYPKSWLSEMDAAISRRQLRSLDDVISRRRRNALAIIGVLGDVDRIELPVAEENVFMTFPIRFVGFTRPARGQRAPELVHLARALLRAGFEPEPTYIPLHLRFPDLDPAVDCPRADDLYWRTMSLPVRPGISESAAAAMAKVVRTFVQHPTQLSG